MAKAKEVKLLADKWRDKKGKRRTAHDWQSALHYPDGRPTTAGLGRSIIACGMGMPPAADLMPWATAAVTVSAACSKRDGASCRNWLWEQIVGERMDNGSWVPGTAPSATIVTAPSLTPEYATAEGGEVLAWVLHGWAGGADVLILPRHDATVASKWQSALRRARHLGIVIVCDDAWQYDLPSGVEAICAETWGVVDGVPTPMHYIPGGKKYTVVPMMIDSPYAKVCSRLATCALGGAVASALAYAGPFAHDPDRRTAMAVELLRDQHRSDSAKYGYELPDMALPFPVVRARLTTHSIDGSGDGVSSRVGELDDVSERIGDGDDTARSAAA